MSGLNGVVDRNLVVDLFTGAALARQLKSGHASLQLQMRIISLLLLLAFFLSPLFITQALAGTLTVQLPGSGTGSVSSSQGGISCPGSCSATLDPGTFVTLSAFPNDNSVFSGWGGACAGMENCAVNMAGDMTVTALFTPKSSPVHVSGSYYGALQKACEGVAAGGIVMAVAQDQPGDLTLNRGINLNLKGGYDAIFSSNTGNVTRVNGTLSLGTGSMTVENIAIGQSASSPTAAPSGIVATAGNGQVSLSWNTMPGATSYNIYYSSSTGVTRATGSKVTGTSVVTGLTNGTTYYFVVTAVSANGESVESGQVIATPLQPAPAAPTGVSAISGNGQATISWNAVSGAASYNIYYSTSSTVSKTNWTNRITNATSGQAVTGLTNTSTYWFVVTAVNTGGESADSSPAAHATPLAPATGFSQADLTGNWYFLRFAAGPNVTSATEAGWMRGTATIAANGTVTVNTILDNLGHTTLPPVGTITWTIDSTGVVTQSGTNALDPGNHGVMAANKQVIVGNGSIGTNRAIYICVKQGVTTFYSTDLSSKTFAYHELYSGSDNEWGYGDGSINSSNLVTVSHSYHPSGPDTPPTGTIALSLSSAGIMTQAGSTTSEGVMTPDKRTVFVTETDTESGHHTLRVIQMTGQTFTQADMAGIWRSHALASSSSTPGWEYDLDYVTIAGVVDHVGTLDSTGNTVPSSNMPTMTLGGTGIITRSDRPAKHGQLSYNKDMGVMTDTNSGLYSLTIALKQ